MDMASGTRSLSHLSAMPHEILSEITSYITSERDAFNLISTCSRIYHVAQERLMRLNAAGSRLAFWWAIVHDNTPLFESILRRDDYPVNEAYKIPELIVPTIYRPFGEPRCIATPLILAIAFLRPEFVKRLLQAGASAEFCPVAEPVHDDLNVWRPILWAVSHGYWLKEKKIGIQEPHQEIIKILLDHGCLTVWTHPYNPEYHISALEIAFGNNCVSGKTTRHLLAKTQSQESPEDLQRIYENSLKQIFYTRRKFFFLRLCDTQGFIIARSLEDIIKQFVPTEKLLQCARFHLQYVSLVGPGSSNLISGCNILVSAAKVLDDARNDQHTPRLVRMRKGYEKLFTMLLAASTSLDGKPFVGEIPCRPSMPREKSFYEGPLRTLFKNQRLWGKSSLGGCLIRFFVNHGASITVAGLDRTVLYELIGLDMVETASLLLNLTGSSIINDQAPTTGWTPLIYVFRRNLFQSCAGNSLKLVKMLLSRGASVSKTDNANQTALHHLCCALRDNPRSMANDKRAKIYSLVKLLLDAGADVLHRDDQGETPLEIAEKGHLRPFIVELMRSRLRNPVLRWILTRPSRAVVGFWRVKG
ncbi:hypothetical protein GQX73_g856 [Xylaria multiplex]|uniref:Uncharacterized protein n=1 Tax=Xylaria multiplex TaxID=323545 RepID=A0A7C8J343_9PEZI|nr:hypothetical protein GQX73_g856 [Xylaria multiplex]